MRIRSHIWRSIKKLFHVADRITRRDLNLSDEENSDIIPTLVEAPPAFDSTSASAVTALFSEDSLAITMGKVSALEAFLTAATRNTSFSEFIRDILVAIMGVVKSEAGSILEADQSNSSLFFRSVVGTSSDRVVNFVIPFGQGIVGHVAESRLPLMVDDVSDNSFHLKSIAKAVGFETRNLIALPIVIRGRVYGVLELLNRIGEKTYSTNDIELLTYLCSMAAKIIELRLMIAWSRAQEKFESESFEVVTSKTSNQTSDPNGEAA